MHEAWSCSWTSAKWFPAKKHKAIVLFLGWRDNLKAENVQKSFAHIIFSNSNTFTIPNFEENSEHPPSCAHELMYRLDNPVNPEWQSTQTVVKMWISSIAMCGWLKHIESNFKTWWPHICSFSCISQIIKPSENQEAFHFLEHVYTSCRNTDCVALLSGLQMSLSSPTWTRQII